MRLMSIRRQPTFKAQNNRPMGTLVVKVDKVFFPFHLSIPQNCRIPCQLLRILLHAEVVLPLPYL